MSTFLRIDIFVNEVVARQGCSVLFSERALLSQVNAAFQRLAEHEWWLNWSVSIAFDGTGLRAPHVLTVVLRINRCRGCEPRLLAELAGALATTAAHSHSVAPGPSALPLVAMSAPATSPLDTDNTKAAARQRSAWPARLNVLTFIIAMGVLIARVSYAAQNVEQPPFWTIVRQPGVISFSFAMFFAAATVFALALHALLSFEDDVRQMGALATLFAAYITIYLGVATSGYIVPMPTSPIAYTQVHEVAILVLFFTLLADAADSTLAWTGLAVLIHVIFAIILGQTNASFQAGNDVVFSLANLRGSPYAGFYVYFVLLALVRLPALTDVQIRRASTTRERWCFRGLILFHEGAWLSFLAFPTIFHNSGVDAAVLFNALIVIAVYLLTVMGVVFLSALSHAHDRDILLMLEKSTRMRAAAEAKDAARSEFLRFIFHEVRVPFNSIMLGLDALQHAAELRGDSAELADVVSLLDGARSMQRILNDTLDFEKMSSGAYTLEFAPLQLRAVLATTVARMQPAATSENVAVAAQVDDDVPQWLLGDANRLMQVMSNFVSNAIKFVDHNGAGRVVVTAACLPSPPVIASSADGPPSAAPAAGPTRLPVKHAWLRFVRLAERADTMLQSLSNVTMRVRRRAWSYICGLSCVQTCAARAATARRQLWHACRANSLCSRETVASASPSRTMGNATGAVATAPVVEYTVPGMHASAEALRTGAAKSVDVREIDLEAASSAIHARDPMACWPQFQQAPICWVRLEVEDNGVGISEAQQSRLFQQFAQIDAGLQQQGRGTGLGLYIAQKIVQMHGGRVGLESTVGRGSKFYADIPLRVLDAATLTRDAAYSGMSGSTGGISVRADASATASAIMPAAPFTPAASDELARLAVGAAAHDARVHAQGSPPLVETAPSLPSQRVGEVALTESPPLSALRVLVVDDSEGNRVLLARALRRRLPQATVTTAENGQQAVDRVLAAGAPAFDAVCIDRHMPVMDGITATVALRRGGFAGRIIGVSGTSSDAEAHLFLHAGADATMSKPVEVDALIKSILASRSDNR